MPVLEWIRKRLDAKKKAATERQLYKAIDRELAFAVSEPLTIGMECELALLNGATLMPAQDGPALVEAIRSPQIKKEGLMHMIEVTSAIGQTVHDTAAQMKSALALLDEACLDRGLLVTGTGRPPTIRTADVMAVDDPRYARIREQKQIFFDRFCALGMHLHIGMDSAGQCIRHHNFFMYFLPHLIALSASSPFEDGIDTGVDAIRPSASEALPIAGLPYHFQTWQDYVHLCHAMYRAKSITDLKDFWWDLRPCPRYGTLEIRLCDQPATLEEGLAIAAFVHTVATWFQNHQDWIDEMPRPNLWRLRDNKWRAMRYGLDAELIADNHGATRPLRDDIAIWLDRTRAIADNLGYAPYIAMLQTMMARGNSASRQRRLFKATGNIETVTRFNCAEFAARTPLWDKLEEWERSTATPLPDQTV